MDTFTHERKHRVAKAAAENICKVTQTSAFERIVLVESVTAQLSRQLISLEPRHVGRTEQSSDVAELFGADDAILSTGLEVGLNKFKMNSVILVDGTACVIKKLGEY